MDVIWKLSGCQGSTDGFGGVRRVLRVAGVRLGAGYGGIAGSGGCYAQDRQRRRVLGDGKGDGVAVAVTVGDRALEAVARERPQDRAGVAAVRQGVRGDVPGPSEKKRERRSVRVAVSEVGEGVQGECGCDGQGRVQRGVRAGEEGSAADVGFEARAREASGASGKEPGGADEGGQVGKYRSEGGRGCGASSEAAKGGAGEQGVGVGSHDGQSLHPGPPGLGSRNFSSGGGYQC